MNHPDPIPQSSETLDLADDALLDLRQRDFGPIHAWCDRRCDRCDVEYECNLAHRMSLLRWAMTELSVDPERAELTLGGLWRRLDDAVELAVMLDKQRELEEERAQPPSDSKRARSERARRLCLLGVDYSAALRALADAVLEAAGSDSELSDRASDLDLAGGMLAVKMADVADAIAAGRSPEADPPASDPQAYFDPDEPPRRSPTWASLLVVERLEAECADEATALAREIGLELDDFATTRARLADALAPLLAAIPGAARQRLEQLAAASLAPSPFSGDTEPMPETPPG